MVSKSKNARPIEFFSPMFAVVLSFDGRTVISDVGDRVTAREIAADLNRDTRVSGYRAKVQRVEVTLAK
jgi:hypothetical protein